MVLNGVKSSWGPVMSGVPWALVLGRIHFNVFVADPDKGIICTFNNFADDT